MKTHHKARPISSRTKGSNLTLGDLIASTYRACGKGAPKILQLALDSQIVRFTQSPAH